MKQPERCVNYIVTRPRLVDANIRLAYKSTDCKLLQAAHDHSKVYPLLHQHGLDKLIKLPVKLGLSMGNCGGGRGGWG